MFRSIKTKIIMTVMVLFLIGISIMTAISSTQVNTKTEDSLINQSVVLIDEMGFSITNFLGQYEKGLLHLSNSHTTAEFVTKESMHEETEAKNTELIFEKELSTFLDVYSDASSVYFGLPTKHLTILPHVDLGSDFDVTSRSWYKSAVENPDSIQWTSPYIDGATGEFVITASKAVWINGKFSGVMGLDIQLEALTAKIAEDELGYGGYPVVFDPEGVAIVHPSLRGENLMELPFIEQMYASGNDKGAIHYDYDGHNKVIVFATIPTVNWKVGAVYDQKNINKMALDLRKSMLIIAFATLLLFFVVLYFMISRTIKPIGQLNSLMDAVSEGDLTVRSDIKTNDEIGELGDNFNTMIDHMNAIITVVNGSATNVRASSESLSAVAEETNASSEEVAHAVTEIAHGASKSAEDAEIVTEKAYLLGQQINEITTKAGVMSNIATKAGEMNTSGQGQMQELKLSFNDWETNLQAMSEVIGTLEE